MAEQIADRYNQSQQMAVHEDGSIDANLVDTTTEGNLESSQFSDVSQVQLLTNILKELKKICFHLSQLTENALDNEDIGG